VINEANSWSMWFLFISIPLCIALAIKFWNSDFMIKHSIK
jgi:hypothetical protein